MSARLSFLNLALRSVGRPLLKRTKTPQRARRDFELAARLFFRGPRRHAEARILSGVPVLDVRPPGAGNDCAILYLHGGGYITGSASTHLPMVGSLAASASVRAVIPDYRLAPEHPFPAGFQDALSVWRGLRAEGVASGRIILAGDSAGGGMALALLAHLLNEGECPAGLLVFSPWTDLTLGGQSLKSNAATDVILPVERIEDLRALVLPDGKMDDPRLSPLFGNFDGAPPVYFQASRTEILLDDTLRMEKRLRHSGVETRVDLWPDAPHVWQLFRGWLPEADDALDRAATFARERLIASSRQS